MACLCQTLRIRFIVVYPLIYFSCYGSCPVEETLRFFVPPTCLQWRRRILGDHFMMALPRVSQRWPLVMLLSQKLQRFAKMGVSLRNEWVRIRGELLGVEMA